MTWVTGHLRWGEHRGGMFVEVTGVDAGGGAAFRRWCMLAEGDAGPLIPSMAVEILLRGLLDGRRPEVGARPCGFEVTLVDYRQAFRRRGISEGEAPSPDAVAPLYRRLLGAEFARLRQPLRAAHDVGENLVLKGRSSVTRGDGLLARAIASIIGFPPVRPLSSDFRFRSR